MAMTAKKNNPAPEDFMDNPTANDLVKLSALCEAILKKLHESSAESATAGQLLVQMTRINSQMFDGTHRALHALNTELTQENKGLRSENATLREELDEARSNKMDREFQMAMLAEANARADRLTETVFRLLKETNLKSVA